MSRPAADGLANKRQKLLEERRELPIWSARTRLITEVQSHACVVVVGETGSGKTTQIPQFLYEAGFGKAGIIACTQPRRVAAVTVARRVAQEMGCQLGDVVGYTIRFDDTTSSCTRIKYMTDGMLLREALIDPLLRRYKVVIVDEVHERTIHTDVLLGLLKGVLAKRQGELRVVVMSATPDAGKLLTYFGLKAACCVRGRQHPVEVLYTAQPQNNYLEAALNATLQIHVDEGPGDVLVFLTGQDEIDSLAGTLRARAERLSGPGGPTTPFSKRRRIEQQDTPNGTAAKGGAGAGGARAALQLLVLPLYAALPPDQQMKVFEPAPPGYRKAVLCTNIAETSVTVAGVRFVVDCGLVKVRAYSARLGADSLDVVPISAAQARQRSGRAGREGPGRAYRLYTEDSFAELALTTTPEILRCNLGSAVLQLKALGVADPASFPFIDPPPRPALLRSLELLYALGALDADGALTQQVGLALSRLPVDPMSGRALLAALRLGCGADMCAVVALVSADNVFYSNRQQEERLVGVRAKFMSREGDHVALLRVWRAFFEVAPRQQHAWASEHALNLRSLRRAREIFVQLERSLRDVAPPGTTLQSCGDDTAKLRRALTYGLFPHATALSPAGGLRVIATGQVVSAHPSSCLAGRVPPLVVYQELVRTSRAYARLVSAVEPAWLTEAAPAFFAQGGAPGA